MRFSPVTAREIRFPTRPSPAVKEVRRTASSARRSAREIGEAGRV